MTTTTTVKYGILSPTHGLLRIESVSNGSGYACNSHTVTFSTYASDPVFAVDTPVEAAYALRNDTPWYNSDERMPCHTKAVTDLCMVVCITTTVDVVLAVFDEPYTLPENAVTNATTYSKGIVRYHIDRKLCPEEWLEGKTSIFRWYGCVAPIIRIEQSKNPDEYYLIIDGI